MFAFDPLRTSGRTDYRLCMEPWFAWSWLLGIKPVHANGWIALGGYLLASAMLGGGALGLFGDHPLLKAVCAFGFLGSSLAFFWVVFSNIRSGSN